MEKKENKEELPERLEDETSDVYYSRVLPKTITVDVCWHIDEHTDKPRFDFDHMDDQYEEEVNKLEPHE